MKVENLNNKISGIYKITSPSNRVYIGQSKNIHKRWTTYLKMSSSNNGQPKLINSFRKHGVENHIFEIIEECPIEELNCRERYWQDFYEVIGDNGLNCTLVNCGTEVLVFSEETLRRKREASLGEKNGMYGRVGHLNPNFGRVYTEEERQIASEKMKGRYDGEKNPFYGKKHTEETLKLLSENAKKKTGEKNPFYGKKHTDEYKEKNSKIIKEWYENNPEKVKKLKEKKSEGLYYTPEGVFMSSRDAAKANNVAKSTILSRCRKNSDKKVGNSAHTPEKYRGDKTWKEQGWYFEYKNKENK